MRRCLSGLVLLALVWCAGCASIKDFVRSKESRETVLILARKTAIGAGMAVLQAAVGQLDREKKADFLQGLSSALWTQVPSVVNAGTVEEIARVWTPDKTHWERLAKELAEDFEAKQPQTKEEALAILHAYAEGLYVATHSTGSGPAGNDGSNGSNGERTER